MSKALIIAIRREYMHHATFLRVLKGQMVRTPSMRKDVQGADIQKQSIYNDPKADIETPIVWESDALWSWVSLTPRKPEKHLQVIKLELPFACPGVSWILNTEDLSVQQSASFWVDARLKLFSRGSCCEMLYEACSFVWLVWFWYQWIK